MENYTLNTENKDIIGGINEVDDIYKPVIENGDRELWESRNEGTKSGTLAQVQYDAIKARIEKGLPIVISVLSSYQYITTYVAISASSSLTPGNYRFCYTGFSFEENEFYIKLVNIKSDLTCHIKTHIIAW